MAQKLTATVLTLLLIAVVASGCGRRSGLEKPSAAAVETNNDRSERDEAAEEKPDRPFILDGLIE